MSNRHPGGWCPDYPIQQYFGDYQHFVQNKAKEWGDLCGADHHVCRFADYPGGDLNATPTGLVRTGVTTRLNRFIDHYAQPPGNPSEPQPAFDVTAALQICPQNASAEFPADEPGPTFTAGSFHELAPHGCASTSTGTQTTTNDVRAEPARVRRPTRSPTSFINGGALPGPHHAGRARAWPSTTASRSPSAATMIGATKVPSTTRPRRRRAAAERPPLRRASRTARR